MLLRYNEDTVLQGIIERRMPYGSKSEEEVQYLTKAVQLPDGTRKYFRARTQEELDEKVLKAQILVKSGVDICSEETFAHFSQMW